MNKFNDKIERKVEQNKENLVIYRILATKQGEYGKKSHPYVKVTTKSPYLYELLCYGWLVPGSPPVKTQTHRGGCHRRQHAWVKECRSGRGLTAAECHGKRHHRQEGTDR